MIVNQIKIFKKSLVFLRIKENMITFAESINDAIVMRKEFTCLLTGYLKLIKE